MTEVDRPFGKEIGGHVGNGHPEEVFDLGGENGEGNTTGEAYDNGVGDETDDGAELECSHEDEEDACHDGGDGKPFDTELLDDAVDDDNESPCGTADLHGAAAEERDEEAGNDGSYQSFFGADAGSDAECNGERQGDNAHDDACHEVGEEFFFIVIFQGME